MKKFILGLVLGSLITGGTATIAINGYQQIIESQYSMMDSLHNKITRLEKSNQEIKTMYFEELKVNANANER